ncbi:hypothetical protein BDQ17DRAFT_1435932 [Cyathus striatus]|nr:hypothetical protein BDQ17DRAFT_1435932 [Cyathus striatus]
MPNTNALSSFDVEGYIVDAASAVVPRILNHTVEHNLDVFVPRYLSFSGVCLRIFQANLSPLNSHPTRISFVLAEAVVGALLIVGILVVIDSLTL